MAPLTVVQVEIRGVDRDGNNTGHMVPGGVVIVVLPYPSPYLDSICAYARRLPKEVGGPSTSYKKNVNSLKMEFSDYWAAKAGRTFLSDKHGAPTDESRLVHVGTNTYHAMKISYYFTEWNLRQQAISILYFESVLI